MHNTANTKDRKFLRTMSIIMIIFACLELILGIILAFAGTLITIGGAMEGVGVAVALGIVMIVLSLVGGVLLLVAGISSLHERRLKMCFIIAIIFFCLLLISVIMNLVQASGTNLDTVSTVTNIVELVVLALYMVSLRKNM